MSYSPIPSSSVYPNSLGVQQRGSLQPFLASGVPINAYDLSALYRKTRIAALIDAYYVSDRAFVVEGIDLFGCAVSASPYRPDAGTIGR